jgi:hypothetical protein
VVVGLVALLQSNSGSNWDTVHPLLDVAAFGLGESLGAIGAAGGGELGSLSLGGERLTYKIGFERGEAAAEAGMELILGKYPANVNYVALTPGAVTLDVPYGWTPMYNAGFIRGFMESGGKIRLVSRNVSGTYETEVKQILTIPGAP